MTPKPTPKPDTRERLIRAFVELCQKHGYAGTGTADILKLAGAPRGSMYHHFPGGKSDLARAAADWFSRSQTEQWRSRHQEGKSAREVVTTLFVETFAWLRRTRFSRGSFLGNLSMGLTEDTEPELSEAVRRAYEVQLAELEEMFRRQGLPASDGALLARKVVAALEGGVVLCRALQSIEPGRAVRARLMDELPA